MGAPFSSNSTVQAPRLILALGIVVFLAGTASVAASGGLSVSIILPASVVFGMGLYFNGAKRYDVMDDKIRTVGILGQRDLHFDKIHGFEDGEPESFTSRLQSILTGAPPSSGIEIKGDRSFFSPPNYLWVAEREAFLRAAREALAAWTAARAINTRSTIEPRHEA
jgi:hypothetical protein